MIFPRDASNTVRANLSLQIKFKGLFQRIVTAGILMTFMETETFLSLDSSVAAVLGFFLWPLISSHEVGLWLEPVLQKLDFGIGELLQKIKENHGNCDTRQYVKSSVSRVGKPF